MCASFRRSVCLISNGAAKNRMRLKPQSPITSPRNNEQCNHATSQHFIERFEYGWIDGRRTLGWIEMAAA